MLNYDNELIRSYPLSHFVNHITYGIHYEDADVRATQIHYSVKGTSFTILYPGGAFAVETVFSIKAQSPGKASRCNKANASLVDSQTCMCSSGYACSIKIINQIVMNA